MGSVEDSVAGVDDCRVNDKSFVLALACEGVGYMRSSKYNAREKPPEHSVESCF